MKAHSLKALYPEIAQKFPRSLPKLKNYKESGRYVSFNRLNVTSKKLTSTTRHHQHQAKIEKERSSGSIRPTIRVFQQMWHKPSLSW